MKDKLTKLQNHIKENPSDYQSVISFFKLRSKQIEWERNHARIERQKLIAECKRKHEEQLSKQCS